MLIGNTIKEQYGMTDAEYDQYLSQTALVQNFIKESVQICEEQDRKLDQHIEEMRQKNQKFKRELYEMNAPYLK